MQNQDVELITRLVMEAIQQQTPSKQGFAVPVYPQDMYICPRQIWRCCSVKAIS